MVYVCIMYMYCGTCTITVVHAMYINVGRVVPQPFFIHVSHFKHSSHWKRALRMFEYGTVCFDGV